MKLYIVPREKITIKTGKTKEDIFASLSKLVGHNYGGKTKLEIYSDRFIVNRRIEMRNYIDLIAYGNICKKEDKNLIVLNLTAKNNYMVFFILFWYFINFCIFSFGIYIMIKDREFQFFIFMPLLFILLGYGLTTLTIQGAIDELTDDIIKSLK